MKKNPWKLTTMILTAALGLTLAYQSIPAARAAIAGKQPHMEAALMALKTAQAELKAADDDKGGFRAKAIDNTGHAIENTQKGIDWANAH